MASMAVASVDQDARLVYTIYGARGGHTPGCPLSTLRHARPLQGQVQHTQS